MEKRAGNGALEKVEGDGALMEGRIAGGPMEGDIRLREMVRRRQRARIVVWTNMWQDVTKVENGEGEDGFGVI